MPLKPSKLYSVAIKYTANVFDSSEKCAAFLAHFNDKLTSVLNVIAFCLLPDEALLLCRVENEVTCEQQLKLTGLLKKDFQTFEEPSGEMLLSNLLQNFVHKHIVEFQVKPAVSFTEIPDEELLNKLTSIHLSPLQNKLCTELAQWKFSSYAAYLSDKPTRLPREMILTLAGGKDAYIASHTLTN